MSTIAGQALFNSGPHRFIIKPVGMLFVPPLTFDPIQTTTDVITPLEFAVIQTGRLIGASEADLWAQVDLIRLRAEARLTGDLVDNASNTWAGMTLLRFAPEDRADRGRAISLAYRADYIRLAP
ncbi:MAG: hypothetical protein D6693_07690 [Planctomycetota bacterium]|nr:MAG: hypothetical protein D6693_07690 [Planctomycetota bacterium]